MSNEQELHNGVDISVDEGTPAIAVKSGYIIEIGNNDEYGNYIKHKTDDNYIIMYAHCKQIFGKVNDLIEQGQILALSGNTGASTGPHLHYTIWYNDELIDPTPFLKF